LKMPSAGVNGRGRRKTSGLIDQSSDLIAFLVAGSPETLAPTRCSLAHRDRVSRFTANAALNGTVAGSELILYQDPQSANAEHYGGALNCGNDGKLHFTTGERFAAPLPNCWRTREARSIASIVTGPFRRTAARRRVV
jgi:glucose/arabinose dehydrogenase